MKVQINRPSGCLRHPGGPDHNACLERRQRIMTAPIITQKICPTCKKLKPVSEFYRNRRTKDGCSSQCMECHKAYYKTTNAIEKTRKWRESYKKRKSENYHRTKNDPGKFENRRKTAIRRKYGITHNEYIELLRSQSGVCALCGKSPNGKPLSVDHCHETGKIRGLLCSGCNAGIGLLGDNVEGLLKAIEYIQAS